MDTLNLTRWAEEFKDIMESRLPLPLMVDDLMDLKTRMFEQKDWVYEQKENSLIRDEEEPGLL